MIVDTDHSEPVKKEEEATAVSVSVSVSERASKSPSPKRVDQRAPLSMSPTHTHTQKPSSISETSVTPPNRKAKAGSSAKAFSIDENKSFARSSGKWTKQEDKALRAAVTKFGAKNWKRISEVAFGRKRSDVQCLHRWQKVLRPGLTKGPWTEAEDKVVVSLVDKANIDDIKWSVVAANLPGRLGKQVRERWYNHLDPQLKKGPYSDEEDQKLLALHAKMGNRWCEIAKEMCGRSENSVKNRWNSARRRMLQIKKQLGAKGKDAKPVKKKKVKRKRAANASAAGKDAKKKKKKTTRKRRTKKEMAAARKAAAAAASKSVTPNRRTPPPIASLSSNSPTPLFATMPLPYQFSYSPTPPGLMAAAPSAVRNGNATSPQNMFRNPMDAAVEAALANAGLNMSAPLVVPSLNLNMKNKFMPLQAYDRNTGGMLPQVSCVSPQPPLRIMAPCFNTTMVSPPQPFTPNTAQNIECAQMLLGLNGFQSM